FHRLQPVGAEIERRAALGVAADAALERLAELHFLRLQHCSSTLTRRTDAGGLSLHHQPVLRHRIVAENLALEDPALDADHAIGCQRLGLGVVDIRAQRVQRNAALAVPLDARDLRAAETAAAGDPDALGAEAESGLHGALHSTAERDAADQLVGHTLGDELRVDLRLADFDDVQLHLALGHRRELGAQLLDVGALLADDDTGARGIDRNAAELGRTLDHHLRDRRLRQALDDVLAQLDVFLEQLRVVAPFGVPAAVPGAVDLQAQADRIALLTHLKPLLPARARRSAAG